MEYKSHVCSETFLLCFEIPNLLYIVWSFPIGLPSIYVWQQLSKNYSLVSFQWEWGHGKFSFIVQSLLLNITLSSWFLFHLFFGTLRVFPSHLIYYILIFTCSVSQKYDWYGGHTTHFPPSDSGILTIFSTQRSTRAHFKYIVPSSFILWLTIVLYDETPWCIWFKFHRQLTYP